MRQSYAVNGAQDRDTHQTRELSVYPHRQHATTPDPAYQQDEERIEYGSLLPSPMTHSVVTRARSEESVRAPWLVFWIAFAVRVVYLTLAHTYRVRPYDDHMLFGEEMGRIARALAMGYGFADPFRGHTGPTAWVGPLFPLLLGGIFKLFGVFSPLSAWVILTFNSLFSALTARTIWEIAARCFSRNVAQWSAWIWALYPAAMQYAVRWFWDTSLSTFLFSLALVLALRLRVDGSLGRWALFGLVWGLTGLSNPALLIFLPACGLWVLAGASERQASGVVLAAVLFTACLGVWTWRNWVAFHHFVPTRGNFGAELYLGNGPGSTGLLMEYDHPIQAPDQLRLYTRMGEIAYSRMRGDQAMEAMHADPLHFAQNSLKRVFFFWAGVPHPVSATPWVEYARSLNFIFASVCGLLGLALALRRKVPAAGLFAWAFLLLPLVYYGVAAHARFRHPLEPLMVILGVYLFQSAELTKTVGKRKLKKLGI
jgi:4-amino-4-deoxy-L-arabinose transferase-like glycosyltransferase